MELRDWLATGCVTEAPDNRKKDESCLPPQSLSFSAHRCGIRGAANSSTVVQYGPNTRQNGGAGLTKDQHEATRFTTPLNLQNLHPRFKSGRRLQIPGSNSIVCAPAAQAHALQLDYGGLQTVDGDGGRILQITVCQPFRPSRGGKGRRFAGPPPSPMVMFSHSPSRSSCST